MLKDKKTESILLKCKKVAKLDRDTNEIIQIYESASEAGRSLKIKNASIAISAVCRGDRKTAYGYK